MWSFIAALIEAFTSLFKSFGRKDVATQTADEANNGARESADISRHTTATIEQELSHAQAQTDADRAAVAAADSLRDIRSSVQDAIDRANSDVRRGRNE